MPLKLTMMEIKIAKILFDFRGMNCNQITANLNAHSFSNNTSKTSVHNHLKRMIDKKVIKATKLNTQDGSGSLYFLSKKGYEFVKDLLGIEYGKVGDGFTKAFGQTSYSDLDFEVYKPPSEQLAHHLFTVDILLQLQANFDFTEVSTHLSHYSAKHFYYNGLNCILRPDAELRLANNKIYCIEADRNTESYDQLVEKFKNYYAYFETINQDELPSAILFVVDINEESPGFKRRWMTVLSAFIFAMGKKYLQLVNLIMTSIDRLVKTLSFEIDMNVTKYYNDYKRQIPSIIGSEYHYLTHYLPRTEHELPNSYFYGSENGYKSIFIPYAHQFESLVYGEFLQFLKRINQPSADLQAILKDRKNKGSFQMIIRNNSQDPLPLNFKKGSISSDILAELELLNDFTTIIPYY